MQIWVVIPRRVAMAEYWYWRVRVLLGFGATLDRPVLISVNQQSLQSSLGTLLHAPFIEQGHRSFWQHLTPALVLAVTIGGLTAGLVFPLAWRLSASPCEIAMCAEPRSSRLSSLLSGCANPSPILDRSDRPYCWGGMMSYTLILNVNTCGLKGQRAVESRY